MSSDRQKPTRISREGVVLIKSFEGFRSRAVQRPDGGWVIGYGHTASAREGLTVSEADAELLLQYDLIPVARALHEQVQVPLNQHQFDALASFAFSVGVERFLASRVLNRVNAGALGEAAEALTQEPDVERAPAPPRRRTAERALFVATPGEPVTLSDLFLTALPFPAQDDGLAADDASGELAQTADILPFPFAGQEPETETQAAPAVSPAAVALHSPYVAATGPLPDLSSQDGAMAEATPLISEGPASETAITAAAITAAAIEPAIENAIALQPSPELTGELQPQADAASSAEAATPAATEDPGATAPQPVSPKRGKHRSDAGKFDWNETGAFLIMGGIGLVAFGAAAAAFRRAGATSSREAFVIGSVLAVIAVVCIVTSSFSLYRRWTTPDAR
ncbi:lysozyme [Brevundimonas sp. PAMC22021]|uniref:lysozyme n=1 Tax=Brevundimonas sp. PAMC22021 TaxID=2861285 RepID=UPI001C62B983|nr:lysozyme [Brevundimonas sp. PAMC22021]QYF87750.1 lysozyme [Brevundimonas sp. PAMC22021]